MYYLRVCLCVSVCLWEGVKFQLIFLRKLFNIFFFWTSHVSINMQKTLSELVYLKWQEELGPHFKKQSSHKFLVFYCGKFKCLLNIHFSIKIWQILYLLTISSGKFELSTTCPPRQWWKSMNHQSCWSWYLMTNIRLE